MRTHKRLKLHKNRNLLLVVMLCFTAGLVLGFLSVQTMGSDQLLEAAKHLQAYLQSFKTEHANTIGTLFMNVFKYAKFVVAIWLLGFVPVGGFAVFVLLIFRGAVYGFTTGLLMKTYGASGLVTSALLYVPQSLVMVPVYCFMGTSSIHYILFNLSGKNAAKMSLKPYVMTLLFGCAFAILAGCFDTFVVPMLIAKI